MSEILLIENDIVNLLEIDDSEILTILDPQVELLTIGEQGAAGASAYQIAVANGFVGTEAEWLASLGAGFHGTMDDIADGSTYVKTENNLTDALAAMIHAPNSDNETASSIATIIDGTTEKTSLVDTDTLPLTEPTTLKKTLWGTIKSTLKTYFDGLYKRKIEVIVDKAYDNTGGAYLQRVNDLDLGDGGTGFFFRLSVTASGTVNPIKISSIKGGTDGRMIFLYSVDGNWALENDQPYGTASNRIRFVFPAEGGITGIQTPANEGVLLVYNGSISRWVVISRTSIKSIGYYQSLGLRLIGENGNSMAFSGGSSTIKIYDTGATYGVYNNFAAFDVRFTNAMPYLKAVDGTWSSIYGYLDGGVYKLRARDSAGNIFELTGGTWLPLTGGSVSGDIEITDATKGIILRSPDGSRFRVTVGDDGALITTGI